MLYSALRNLMRSGTATLGCAERTHSGNEGPLPNGYLSVLGKVLDSKRPRRTGAEGSSASHVAAEAASHKFLPKLGESWRFNFLVVESPGPYTNRAVRSHNFLRSHLNPRKVLANSTTLTAVSAARKPASSRTEYAADPQIRAPGSPNLACFSRSRSHR